MSRAVPGVALPRLVSPAWGVGFCVAGCPRALVPGEDPWGGGAGPSALGHL